SDCEWWAGVRERVYGKILWELLSVQGALSLPNTPANAAARQKPNTDWLGIAIHCAQGSARCANGKDDLLPDERGGYIGFKALFGNVNVQPAISATPIKDLNGVVIADAFGQPGFPNIFNPHPSQTLGYLAAMLDAGVQVVYGYIADAHDNRHGNNPNTFGPGEAAYVAQAQEYETAFAKFFDRLAAAGIDKSNTRAKPRRVRWCERSLYIRRSGHRATECRRTHCEPGLHAVNPAR